MIGRISFWGILYIIIYGFFFLGMIIYKRSTIAGCLYFPVALFAVLYIHNAGTRYLGQKMQELIAGIFLAGIITCTFIVIIGKTFFK